MIFFIQPSFYFRHRNYLINKTFKWWITHEWIPVAFRTQFETSYSDPFCFFLSFFLFHFINIYITKWIKTFQINSQRLSAEVWREKNDRSLAMGKFNLIHLIIISLGTFVVYYFIYSFNFIFLRWSEKNYVFCIAVVMRITAKFYNIFRKQRCENYGNLMKLKIDFFNSISK